MIMKWSSVYTLFVLVCLAWRTGRALTRQDVVKPDLVPKIISSAIKAANGKGAETSKKSAISGTFYYLLLIMKSRILTLLVDARIHQMRKNTENIQFLHKMSPCIFVIINNIQFSVPK